MSVVVSGAHVYLVSSNTLGQPCVKATGSHPGQLQRSTFNVQCVQYSNNCTSVRSCMYDNEPQEPHQPSPLSCARVSHLETFIVIVHYILILADTHQKKNCKSKTRKKQIEMGQTGIREVWTPTGDIRGRLFNPCCLQSEIERHGWDRNHPNPKSRESERIHSQRSPSPSRCAAFISSISKRPDVFIYASWIFCFVPALVDVSYRPRMTMY